MELELEALEMLKSLTEKVPTSAPSRSRAQLAGPHPRAAAALPAQIADSGAAQAAPSEPAEEDEEAQLQRVLELSLAESDAYLIRREQLEAAQHEKEEAELKMVREMRPRLTAGSSTPLATRALAAHPWCVSAGARALASA